MSTDSHEPELLKLPEEYKFSHDYCLFLYDILVEILRSGEKAGIFNQIIFNFKDEAQAKEYEEANLQGEALFDWLDANGFLAEMHLYSYKQAVVALLSDYLQFMLAALRCAEKGNLTVTFALLRKPLKENLFMFEWLLSEPVESIKTFRFSGAEALDKKIRRKNGKLETLKLVNTLIKNKNRFDPELIYKLRFEASEPHGFERVWNQATHLVTTFEDMETETHNFNFIFSGLEQKHTQWRLLYLRLPMLIDYTIDVIESLIATFAKRENEDDNTVEMRRLAGMYLWARKFLDAELGFDLSVLKAVSHCDDCNTDSNVEEEDMELLYEIGEIPCAKCLMDELKGKGGDLEGLM